MISGLGHYDKEPVQITQNRIVSSFNFSNIAATPSLKSTTITGHISLNLKSYLLAKAFVVIVSADGAAAVEERVILWSKNEEERTMWPREYERDFEVVLSGLGKEVGALPRRVRIRAVVERPKETAGDLVWETEVEVR